MRRRQARPAARPQRPGLGARLGAGIALAVAAACGSAAYADDPGQNYILYCMGCHGEHAEGVPGKVPPLANTIGRFMRTPEGRNYLLRVPGAANSVLSDAQLTAVLNWLAQTYDRTSLANGDVRLFTTAEVTSQRHSPLASVLATRNQVIHDLAATGPAPPSSY
ncbi:MAG TPA: cytochrome c [Steroidobacteraceae bacterium]|nr:cytochrome c [Steroidobacteraceae bacterium]